MNLLAKCEKCSLYTEVKVEFFKSWVCPNCGLNNKEIMFDCADYKMTPDNASRLLKDLKKKEEEDGDCEPYHVCADFVLCSLLNYLGHEEVSKKFMDLTRWYA